MKKIALFSLTLLVGLSVVHAQDLQKISQPVYDNQNKEDGFRNRENVFGDLATSNTPTYSALEVPRKLTDNKVEKINLNDRTVIIDPREYDLTRNMPSKMLYMWKMNSQIDWRPLKKL